MAWFPRVGARGRHGGGLGMVAQGRGRRQGGSNLRPDPSVPGVLAPEARTYAFYTGSLLAPPAGAGWNDGATRGWFARALWQALNSYWGTDGNLQDGRPAGGMVP